MVTTSGSGGNLGGVQARLWLALGVVFAASATAQAVVSCRACSNRGNVVCNRHGKLLAREQVEAGTLFCSVAADCRVCAGALASDCKACANTPAEDELRRRQELVREWLKKRRAAVDEVVENKGLLHLETTHCDLVFSIRSATVGKERLDTHALMHAYGDRIEALRALFRQVLEVADEDLPARMRVYMFRDAHDQGVIGPRETGFGTTGSVGLKQMGPEFVYSMWQDPQSLADDEALHRNVVHHVTHLLLSQMLPTQFLGNKGHGWIDEGLAHWFEDKVTGRCANFCFEEVLLHPGTGWKGGRWRAPVRRLVDDGKLPTFAALSALNTDQLAFEDHAAAFACVDFLLTVHGGARLRDLVRLVKRGQPTREALQAVYGWNPITFDAPFQKWVRETYAPTDPR